MQLGTQNSRGQRTMLVPPRESPPFSCPLSEPAVHPNATLPEGEMLGWGGGPRLSPSQVRSELATDARRRSHLANAGGSDLPRLRGIPAEVPASGCWEQEVGYFSFTEKGP